MVQFLAVPGVKHMNTHHQSLKAFENILLDLMINWLKQANLHSSNNIFSFVRESKYLCIDYFPFRMKPGYHHSGRKQWKGSEKEKQVFEYEMSISF
ncbi:hypothetical protein D3C85_1595580 [compost metagenome]